MSETITRISEVWPPKDGEWKGCDTWRHRDGRTVKLIYGPVCENAAQQKMLAERGNVSGTLGSIHLFEAFPGEDVCAGCVGLFASSRIDPNGKEIYKFGTSHPRYNNGVRGDYCPKCREREGAEKTEAYRRDMKALGIPIEVPAKDSTLTGKPCDCWEKMDALLSEKGLQLSRKHTALNLSPGAGNVVHMLSLDRIDGGKLKREDAKSFFMTHCPFCGKKF